jgi:hypothetical protein
MILLMATLLIITGCGNSKNAQGGGAAGGANSGISGSGEIRTPTFETYESYLKFIKTADVPDNFVTYEMISSFGEFRSFICAPSYGYDEYKYGIIDKESGVELLVYIDDGCEITIPEKAVVISSSDVIANDMRKLPNQEEGIKCFVQSGVQYTYYGGKLSSVEWIDNGIRYTIFDNDFYICSLDSSSALAKLLKLDSVGEAIAAVKKQPAASK